MFGHGKGDGKGKTESKKEIKERKKRRPPYRIQLLGVGEYYITGIT